MKEEQKHEKKLGEAILYIFSNAALTFMCLD